MQLLRKFILLDGSEKSIATFVIVSRKQFFIAQQCLENIIFVQKSKNMVFPKNSQKTNGKTRQN